MDGCAGCGGDGAVGGGAGCGGDVVVEIKSAKGNKKGRWERPGIFSWAPSLGLPPNAVLTTKRGDYC